MSDTPQWIKDLPDCSVAFRRQLEGTIRRCRGQRVRILPAAGESFTADDGFASGWLYYWIQGVVITAENRKAELRWAQEEACRRLRHAEHLERYAAQVRRGEQVRKLRRERWLIEKKLLAFARAAGKAGT